MHLIFIVWFGLKRPILEVRINHSPIYTRVIGAAPPPYSMGTALNPNKTVIQQAEKRFSCLLNRKIPDVSQVGYSCLRNGPFDHNSAGF